MNEDKNQHERERTLKLGIPVEYSFHPSSMGKKMDPLT